ncbi:MAG: glycosyltransferase family 10 [Rickettsia endosymbiont of Argas persicus]
MWPSFELNHLPMLKEIIEESGRKIIIDHENYDLIIDSVFGQEKISKPSSIKIFFTGEAVKPNPDNYDIAIGFDYIDRPNYIRIPLYYMYFTNDISTEYKRPKCNPNKPHFACFLVSGHIETGEYDGCVARSNIFHRLSLYKKVRSGRKYLNNEFALVPIENTKAWLSECKFVIAYENKTYEGYVTEKPFQAYLAGAIPIYYADKSYVKDINPKSVIFAKDYSEEELYNYIISIDQDDEKYCEIYNNPIVPDQENNYVEIKEKLRKKLLPLLKKI